MNALLEQFLIEARDFLQGIGEKLMALESAPESEALMTELFRLVHTLKGNSGLFDFPDMTRVLHAGEDLMDAVRDGRLPFSADLADDLLDAMDFVGLLLDEIELSGRCGDEHAATTADKVRSLRAHLANAMPLVTHSAPGNEGSPIAEIKTTDADTGFSLDELPEAIRALVEDAADPQAFHLVCYRPDADCFFKGEDPFHQARLTPDVVWGRVRARTPWPSLDALDPYGCALEFQLLSRATLAALSAHYRYVSEQVVIAPAFSASNFETAEESPTQRCLQQILDTQQEVLAQTSQPPWWEGRLRACASTLQSALNTLTGLNEEIEAALDKSLAEQSSTPLGEWLARYRQQDSAAVTEVVPTPPEMTKAAVEDTPTRSLVPQNENNAAREVQRIEPAPSVAEPEIKAGRRSEDAVGSKVLKVDKTKVDRLMNLIGEMVVAKNALPYLANRAEQQYGVRDLSREIKAQYAVINRIAEEMQDAIMQVCMMAVSFIFQRFPRLVRDISRKLGKEVELIIEGEETEADKAIIEALADPLIHVIRNSLDHGLEPPDERVANGKTRAGKLRIKAMQASDRVLIEISDDGRGIDPEKVKRKALEKGLIDEQRYAQLTSQEAINLVFMPGFSTAESISDLSGRGVGMDVVRSAIARVGGTVAISSQLGKGTSLRLSLPLSMAVTHVMIIETDKQIFGVPMEAVVETVRLPRGDIRHIKQQMTTVLRGRIVPLVSLNELLAIPAAPIANEEDELATLLVRVGGEQIGLIVDDFNEVVDVILKPLPGELANLSCYAGSALLGDGSVLMVLNPEELL